MNDEFTQEQLIRIKIIVNKEIQDLILRIKEELFKN